MIKTLGGRRLGRTGEHRRAMLANLATSLFLHEKIQTTTSKAKELKGFAERILGDARKGKKMEVRRIIRDRNVYEKLFEVLAPRYQTRPGGFVQVLRVGRRAGDDAKMSLVRLVG